MRNQLYARVLRLQDAVFGRYTSSPFQNFVLLICMLPLQKCTSHLEIWNAAKTTTIFTLQKITKRRVYHLVFCCNVKFFLQLIMVQNKHEFALFNFALLNKIQPIKRERDSCSSRESLQSPNRQKASDLN